MRDGSESPSRRTLVLVGTVYFLVAVLWAAPGSLAPLDTVPNPGDPLTLAWVMAWDAHALARAPLSLFDANAFFPYAKSLTFSDHLLPEALSVAPLFWLTGNAVLGLNVATVLALFLSALFMFLFARRLTGSDPAGFLAGLVYAFNSFTLHEIPRLNVISVQWWPLGLLFLHRFAESGKARQAALATACLVLQGLSGTYYLYYMVFIAPIWIAGAYWSAERKPSLREIVRGGAAALGVAAPAAIVLWPYAVRFWEMGFEKTINEPLQSLSDEIVAVLLSRGFEREFQPGANLLSYLNPGQGNWIWGVFHSSAVDSELPHFIGFASAVLVGAGILLIRRYPTPIRRLGLVALLTAGVGVALSLGVEMRIGSASVGSGPYRILYQYLPFARGMATPERAGVLACFGVAVLVALAAARFLERITGPLRYTAAACLALVLSFEHWTPPGAGGSVPTGSVVPGVYRWLADGSRLPTVDLPLYPARERILWSTYLYFSTYHWRPILFGRASFYPPAHELLAWSCRDFPNGPCIPLLQRLGIAHIVVHPLVWPESERAARLEALDSDDRLRLLRVFTDRPPERFQTLQLGNERVYRLGPLQTSPEPLCQPADEIPRDRWRLRGNGLNSPELARDGDRRTAWFTLEPQIPGSYLEIDFGATETVSAVVLEMAYPYGNFPRGIALMAPDGSRWKEAPHVDDEARRWETIELLLKRPTQAHWVWPIEPLRTHSLLLVLRHEREWANPRWSVPELRVFRRCE